MCVRRLLEIDIIASRFYIVQALLLCLKSAVLVVMMLMMMMLVRAK